MMKKKLAIVFTPIKFQPKFNTSDDLGTIPRSLLPQLELERSPSTPPFNAPDPVAPVRSSEAVQWIKNYNPESSASKLPQAVYQKRFQTARIDVARRKKGIGSGILIAPNMILTARHCLDKISQEELKIRFGIHKNGDVGDTPYLVSAVHASDSDVAAKLGLKAGPKADLVLLELETAGRQSPGEKYGFTPIKPITEDHAKSGLYLFDYASGRHLKASAMMTRPVLLAKSLEKAKDLKKLEGKPIFWNDGAQHGRVLSVTRDKQEAFVWIRVESDTRSKKGYSDQRFKVSFADGSVYNNKGELLHSDVFMGRNILFGTDHIVVAHKAFGGGSGGIFLTKEGDIFAVLCGVLDSVVSDLPHHVAVRPDVEQHFQGLFKGYMTPERTPEEIKLDKQGFDQYKQKALKIFGASIGFSDLYILYRKGAELSRVGGHDKLRNKSGGNQVGASKAADDHGINQGNQWTKFRDQMIGSMEHKDKEKYLVQYKELEKPLLIEIETPPPKIKTTGQRHSPEEAQAHADKKAADKAHKAAQKKELYEASLNKENVQNRRRN